MIIYIYIWKKGIYVYEAKKINIHIYYIYIYEEMVLYRKMRIIRLCDSDLYIKETYLY